jgi:hypothetical protein
MLPRKTRIAADLGRQTKRRQFAEFTKVADLRPATPFAAWIVSSPQSGDFRYFS